MILSTGYYLAGSERIAMRVITLWVVDGGSSQLYYLFTDHLGSTSEVRRADGSLHSRQYYRAFGEERLLTPPNPDLPTDRTYTGQREIENGLVHYGARVYDPYLNRFLSPDSIVPEPFNPLDWDRFSYVRNNPVNNTDPSGNIICEDSFDYCNPNDVRLRLDWFTFNIVTGIWVIPEAINHTIYISDSPAELITRAILGEEPGKLNGPYEDDAVGVAWAIRNRHDSGYYKKNGDLDWYYSANSEIYGNRTLRATDPIGSGYWKDWKDAVYAYNRARSIANRVLSAPASSDITGGNSRWGWWADAVAPNGQQPNIIRTNYGKTCTNCLPVQRTRFTYGVFHQVGQYPSWDDHYDFDAAVCVNTAEVCN